MCQRATQEITNNIHAHHWNDETLKVSGLQFLSHSSLSQSECLDRYLCMATVVLFVFGKAVVIQLWATYGSGNLLLIQTEKRDDYCECLNNTPPSKEDPCTQNTLGYFMYGCVFMGFSLFGKGEAHALLCPCFCTLTISVKRVHRALRWLLPHNKCVTPWKDKDQFSNLLPIFPLHGTTPTTFFFQFSNGFLQPLNIECSKASQCCHKDR